MKNILLTCFIVAAAMALQAQKMKPQKMTEYSWDTQGQKWNAEYTYKMRYNNAGDLIYRDIFDHISGKPTFADSIAYNAQGKEVCTISSWWSTAQNSFVFSTRTDNCYDVQQRDCGRSNFYWQGNAWSFTGGYQKTYIANTANNSLTQTLRVWDNNTKEFEPQESNVTYHNTDGSKAFVVTNLRDGNTGFLVPNSKKTYAGWHNEAAGIYTAMETFNHDGSSWIAGAKTLVADSGNYWKYISQNAAGIARGFTRIAKNESFTEKVSIQNGVELLHYTYYKNGLTVTEIWLDYDANNVLHHQHKVITKRNVHEDITSISNYTWTPISGWLKDAEHNFQITYDAFGNMTELIATTYEAASGLTKNDYRFIYSDFTSIGSPTNTCGLSPTITGDLMICPNDETTLSTQQHDSYQWYTRPFGANTLPEPVTGATNQTFVITHSMGKMYVSVTVFDDTCAETSAEVLVDGYNFPPLSVSSSGNFIVLPDGAQVICPGEAITMVVNLPYVNNFVWFNDNEMLTDGFNKNTLVVNEPGKYWVVGSPAECPNWSDALETLITVLLANPADCTTGFEDVEDIEAKVFPNPATNLVNIELPREGSNKVVLYDLSGREVLTKTFELNTQVDVSALEPGIYLVGIAGYKNKAFTKLIVK